MQYPYVPHVPGFMLGTALFEVLLIQKFDYSGQMSIRKLSEPFICPNLSD